MGFCLEVERVPLFEEFFVTVFWEWDFDILKTCVLEFLVPVFTKLIKLLGAELILGVWQQVLPQG